MGMSQDDTGPLLPYAGTSGWSGSETSRQRALDADHTGVTGKRQRMTLRLLDVAGADGLTWTELGRALGVHHGSASGVLSVLHKEGRICRLTEVRNKCRVYVLPEHVQDRETEPHGRQRNAEQEPPGR
jgi:hypothetical protein